MDASQSILTSIKAPLGYSEDDDPFDFELAMHIDSALSDMVDFGIGPKEGLQLDGKNTKWSDLIEDQRKLNSVKAYIYLKVKMVFDPPSNPSIITAYKEQMDEHAWRLTQRADPMLPLIPLNTPTEEIGYDEDGEPYLLDKEV